MATQRSSFAKLQRDRDKKAKAAAKRQRREERQSTPDETEHLEPLLDDDGAVLSAPQLLGLVELVHQQFEDGVIDQEEFEERKAALLARLPID